MENTISDELLAKIYDAVHSRLTSDPLRAKYAQVVLGVATAREVVAGADNGAVIHASADNSVITLPLASSCPGQDVTVINDAASGAAKLSISPNSANGICGTVGAVSLAGTVNKDAINTKATAVKGDYLKLISDGLLTWWIVGGVGVWAAEA